MRRQELIAEAKIERIRVQREMMATANIGREMNGEAQAYNEGAFSRLLNELDIIIGDIELYVD